MVKLRSILAKTPRDWLGWLEASALLALARLVIAVVPARHWRLDLSDKGEPEAKVRLTPGERETVLAVSRSIARAVRHAPMKFICLPQALTARWMLRRRGITPQLFFGTRREAEDNREFHVWVKVGPIWVTGHCEVSEYVVFGPRMS